MFVFLCIVLRLTSTQKDRHNHGASPISHAMFLGFYDPERFYSEGLTFSPVLMRGLPKPEDIFTLAISADIIHIFRRLIMPGYYHVQKLGDCSLEKQKAVDHIVKAGWAYRYLEHVQISGPHATEEIWDIMIPASPTHRAYLSWVTCKTSSILSLLRNVAPSPFLPFGIPHMPLLQPQRPPS